jgi:hypothetical protein
MANAKRLKRLHFSDPLTVLASGSRHVCELFESDTALGKNTNGLPDDTAARSRLPPALQRQPGGDPARRRSAVAANAAGIGTLEVAAITPVAVAIGGGSERGHGNGAE